MEARNHSGGIMFLNRLFNLHVGLTNYSLTSSILITAWLQSDEKYTTAKYNNRVQTYAYQDLIWETFGRGG